MTTRLLYSELASMIQARLNCIGPKPYRLMIQTQDAVWHEISQHKTRSSAQEALSGRGGGVYRIDFTPTNPEWYERWSDRIRDIEHNLLPSGSGIDSGTKID